ncbi:ATP-dependent helicase [Micromonospora sp. NIE79]|uniref:ATP-dependent helicase n=2 Tax=Micromonospora trifolii TaxID=2911208 RepID=A0ABS9N9M9_9ACTN|nr:ATP-dependent helicase [Micromonospora trifolii]
MPAGTGKTEIIAAMSCLASNAQARALILTHTHAGVDALRRRIRTMGVRSDAVRIDTIASWSHHLVRQYPHLAGMTVPDEPDWSQSVLCYRGAAQVVRSPSIQRVLAATFAFAIIDEYQDCTLSQHALTTAVAAALPLAVLGDPLQAIFGWDPDDPLPSWRDEIKSRWPELTINAYPWRWHNHHQQLGQWLLGIREKFDQQRPLLVSGETPVRWIQSDKYRAMVRACRDLRSEFPHDSIVAIGVRAEDCHGVARSLNGAYSVMETIEGKDMVDFAKTIDSGDAARIAAATAQWGKTCISGISELVKSGDVQRLAGGKLLTGLRRPGAENVQISLSAILTDPSPTTVREALLNIAQLPGGATYRHDAWYTMLSALRTADAGGQLVAESVIQHRNRTRATGRRASRYTLSRPTLIKGLEYDHAVVLDADQHEPTNLYVALTRARKTLTVISAKPELRTAPRRSAKAARKSIQQNLHRVD